MYQAQNNTQLAHFQGIAGCIRKPGAGVIVVSFIFISMLFVILLVTIFFAQLKLA
jgi:hypothetical protein